MSQQIPLLGMVGSQPPADFTAAFAPLAWLLLAFVVCAATVVFVRRERPSRVARSRGSRTRSWAAIAREPVPSGPLPWAGARVRPS
jgi:hypothetical protein